MTEQTLTGGCLCGAVRYVATGAPINVRICHCRICQKATGQPFFARALFPGAAVTITGEPKAVASSALLERLFCPECGTGLFGRRRGSTEVLAITLGSLDDPNALEPETQIWTSSRVAWMEDLGGIPSHPEFAPT